MAKRDPSRDHGGFKAYIESTSKSDRVAKSSGYRGTGRAAFYDMPVPVPEKSEDETVPAGPRM